MPDLARYRDLTRLQFGMLVDLARGARPGTYIEQTVFRGSGPIGVEACTRAWNAVVQARDVLRTRIVEVNGLFKQESCVVEPVPVEWIDLRGRGAGPSLVRQALAETRRRGINVDSPPLARLTIVALDDGDWLLALTHHHVLLDAWSVELVVQDFLDELAQPGRLEASALPKWASYLDWLAGQPRRPLLKREARGASSPVFVRQGVEGDDAAEVGSATRRLGELEGVGAFTAGSVCAAAWALVIARRRLARHVRFALATSGRAAAFRDVDDVAGLLMQTMPINVEVGPEHTGRQLLTACRREVGDCIALEGLCDLVSAGSEEGGEKGSWGWSGIDSLLVVENVARSRRAGLRAAGSDHGLVEIDGYEDTGFPLAVIAYPGAPGELLLEFDRAAIDQEGAEEVLDELVNAIAWLRENTETVIRAYLNGSATRSDPEGPNEVVPTLAGATGKRIWQYLQERADETPDSIAVEHGADNLTFRELVGQAADLGTGLLTTTTALSGPIGVMLDKGPDLVVALLGVNWAGRAFAVLDASYPEARLRHMLRAGHITSVITDRPEVASDAGAVQVLDPGALKVASQQCGLPPAPAEQPAYLIFTSGSTGSPKAVMIGHMAVSNLIEWSRELFTDIANTLSATSPSFDLFVFEALCSLAHGVRVTLLDGPDELCVAADPGKGVLINTVPSVAQALVAGGGLPSAAARIVLAGERLTNELVEEIQVTVEGAEVVNCYAPSETTTYSTVWRVDGVEGASIPIGVPIANTQVYVLDEAGARVPAGVQGELFIGGAGVAEGYLGRYDETARRFVPDPFSGIPGARMYRTGDIGWMRQDGVLEYVGRQDDQVKIRGYRVEVGEVEVAVAGCPGVQSAAVVAVADSARGVALHGFFAGEADQAAVRQHLIEMLPAYMVPGALTQIDRMPLTPNGKVDRAALRERAIPEAKVGHTAGVPPRTEAERLLCEIWKDVLGLDHEVSVTDNFFELGGDSILSIQVIARARRNGFAVQLRDVLRAADLRELAQALDGDRARV